MDFDPNDLDQLPDPEWFANPPEWFRYFVNRLAVWNGAEVDDALEKISPWGQVPDWYVSPDERSEEHTSELQSLMCISYAVFCLKKKKKTIMNIQQSLDKPLH